ncbi:MAG: polysaccharide biosynthesis tyrosine autokinase [Anaerolineae bacterium]|nr:polysaccharide biosynthesis tyrosine autokinase [Anaerolineae bacterium]
MEITRYFQVVLRWWWVVVLTIAIAVGVVAVASLRRVPTYTSNAILSIVAVGTNLPDYGSYVYFDRLANTYLNIAKSGKVTDEAEKMLGVTELPVYRIELVPQTELLLFSVDADDPAFAQKACNVLVDLLIQANRDRYTDTGRLQGLEQEVTRLDNELSQLDKQKSDAENAIPRDEQKIADLNRAILTKQNNYNAASNLYFQTLNTLSTLSNALTKIDPASLPEKASDRNPLVNIAIAGIAGLLAGTALTFLFENSNTHLFSNRQIETVTQTSVIGKVPPMNRKERADPFKASIITAEAFRRIRIALFPAINEAAHRTILVTSSVPQEGKSTVAANLARAVAQVVDQCVVVIDCDLRRPNLHKVFEVADSDGLTDYLNGEIQADDILRETSQSRLNVITAGVRVTNPTELLASQRMVELMEELSTRFTTIILDAPPILAATDAVALANRVSGVVFVMDANRVNEKTVRLAMSQMNTPEIHLAGVVLNRARLDTSFQYLRYYNRGRKKR